MSSLLPVVLLMTQVELPGTSSVTTPLTSSETCRACHGPFDPGETAYESWVGSPMGHAARNPLFLSALLEAENDSPGNGGFCLQCHAPDAWLTGTVCVEPDGSLLTEEDDGVGCAVCHRMEPSPWLKNGQYIIAEDIVYRGPYEVSAAPHAFQQSDWISTSELCASCHDLFNPLVMRRDLDGSPMNMMFPEQTTYTEWATSSVAASLGCKDCHMPETTGRVGDLGPVREDRSRHEFSGGNLFSLGAIDFLEPGLGISEQLSLGMARVEAQLRSAATLEVQAPNEVLRGEPFSVVVRVTNETGHKLPTGYPEGRRVWIEMTSPELALRRGRFDSATGEPIDPLAIYHTQQGQFGMGPGHHLVLNDVVFLDTRIPPRGMIVTATTAPVGKTFPEVAPGILAHWDEVTLTATTPCDMALDQISLRTALWYQSVTKTYVDTLVDAAGAANPRSMRLRAAFEEADPGPTEMASIALNVPIAEGSACAAIDAGFVDTGITDAADGRPDAEVTTDAGQTMMPEPEGCSCRASSRADGLEVLGLIVLLFAARKRR